jgi:hypothetical protein
MAVLIVKADSIYWYHCSQVFQAPMPVSVHAGIHWIPLRLLMRDLVSDATLVREAEDFTCHHPELQRMLRVVTYQMYSGMGTGEQVGWCIAEQALPYWLAAMPRTVLAAHYHALADDLQRQALRPPCEGPRSIRSAGAQGRAFSRFVALLAATVSKQHELTEP